MIAAGDSEAGTTASNDPFFRLLLVLLIAAAAVRLYLLFSTHATEEDFYITLRYAENIAAGRGFVYNSGAHVLGTTTPLYTLLIALFMRLGLPAVLCGKLVGIAADLLTMYFTYRISKAMGRPGAGIAAAIGIAFAPTNLIWSVKGMEVGLVAAAIAGTWMAWTERRDILAWAFAALLVLLRIDGAALAAVLFAAMLLRDRRIPWRPVALFAVIIAPWMLFATLYFGSPVPLSVMAKLTVYGRMSAGTFPHLFEFLWLMVHNPINLVAVVGCLLYAVTCARGNGAAPRPRSVLTPNAQRQTPTAKPPTPTLAPALVWMAIYYAGMALSPVFLFGWYFVPPTPILYIAGAVGLSMAAERAARSRAPAPRTQFTVAAGCAALLAAVVVPITRRTLVQGQAVETKIRIPIGKWLRANVSPNETLMLEPIGYIGYISRLKVIDEIGLVSPEALASYQAQVACPAHDLWQRLRPDWILLRAGEIDTLARCEQAMSLADRLGSAYTISKIWPDPVDSKKTTFVLFKKRTKLPDPHLTSPRGRGTTLPNQNHGESPGSFRDLRSG